MKKLSTRTWKRIFTGSILFALLSEFVQIIDTHLSLYSIGLYAVPLVIVGMIVAAIALTELHRRGELD